MRFGFGLAVLSTALLASACSGTKLSQKEAEAVFAGQNKVVGDVYRSLYDAVANNQVPDGIAITGDTSNGTVTGDLSQGPSWDGDIAVDGAIASDVDAGTFDLDVATTYAGVVVENLTLDGDTALVISANLDINAGTFSFLFDTSGGLDVTGDAAGHADFQYTLSVDVDVNSAAYDFSSDGEINGYSTTEMSVSNLAAWVAALYT